MRTPPVLRPSRTRAWCERMFVAVERLVTALLYPYGLLRQRWGRRPAVPILMYHQVSRPVDGATFGDCVSPERFELQVRAIQNAGYRVIPLQSLVRAMRQSPPPALARCVVITFDDGFRDQFRNAYPVLRRHGLPATFFLIAGYLGTDSLFPHLAPAGAHTDAPEAWLPLTWDQARAMAQHGMDIGSHTVWHRSLGCLPLEEARREVEQSREILEQRLGHPVKFFAYPFGSRAYGDFTPAIADLLRQAGYGGACTTVVGTSGPGVDAFALRRIPMEEADGAFRVRCKLVGAYDWVGRIKNAWQRLVPREDRVDAGLVLRATPDEG
ncbi:MAG: polysaccharide deacetylase family protein [candidate division NC10 bacterium]|nr:polysaccharide deacetylase family protein [candidate division NC10 bacterium]MBI2455608.1 polysaccharide deacetylase family protein [candidate division NC10 bacterium]